MKSFYKNLSLSVGFFLSVPLIVQAQTVCEISFTDSSPGNATRTVDDTNAHSFEVRVDLAGLANNHTYSYHWRKNGQRIGPAVNTNPAYGEPVERAGRQEVVLLYTLDPGTFDTVHAGDFDVVVEAECDGSAADPITSSDGRITVNPRLISFPPSQTADVESNVTIPVVAEGSDLTYEWEYRDDEFSGSFVTIADGDDYAGATTDTLTVRNLSAELTGQYRVTIRHIHGNGSVTTYRRYHRDHGYLAIPFTTDRFCTLEPSIADGVYPSGGHPAGADLPVGGFHEIFSSLESDGISNLNNSFFGGSSCFRVATSAPNDDIYSCLIPDATANNGERTVYVQSDDNVFNSTYRVLKDGQEVQPTSPVGDFFGSGEAYFFINQASVDDAGSYTFEYSTVCGDLTSNPAAITVNVQAPTISNVYIESNQGRNGDVYQRQYGARADFHSSYSGTVTSANWEILQNGMWIDVEDLNNDRFQNVNHATSFRLNNIVLEDSARFRLTLCNTPAACTSGEVELDVIPYAPDLVTLEADDVLDQQFVSLFAIASVGTPPFSFKWERSDNDGMSWTTVREVTDSLDNAKLVDFYSLAPATKADDHNDLYRVTISNRSGEETSSEFRIEVQDAAPAVINIGANRNVALGSSITLSPAIVGGTQPLTYQWIKNGGEIIGATSQDLTISDFQAEDAGTYQIAVTNGAGETRSNSIQLSLDGDSGDAIIITNNLPASVSLSSGETLMLGIQVDYSGSDPLTYQWYKNGTPILGETSSTLMIDSVTADDAATYYVAVTNGTNNAVSQVTNVSISLALADKPDFLRPTDGASDVNQRPRLEWRASTETDATGNVTYDFSLGRDGEATCEDQQSSGIFKETGLEVERFDVPVRLDPDFTYFACIRSVNESGDSKGYSRISFTTQSDDLSAPVLLGTRPGGSGGNINLIVSGEQGQSEVRLYEIIGTQELLVSSLEPEADGSFEFIINPELYQTGNGERIYMARNARSAGPNAVDLGPRSGELRYQHDRRLALSAPELFKEGTQPGSLRWTESPNATAYEIYRRVGDEKCSEDCFLGKKPFTLIHTHTELDNLTFVDPNYTSNPKGSAYFVVATDIENQFASVRSNAQVFEDQTAPELTSERMEYVALESGREIQVYYCGIDPDGFLDTDTDPDQINKDQILELPSEYESCDEFATAEDFDRLAPSIPTAFDALTSLTVKNESNQRVLDNCVFASKLINQRPNRTYCVRSCLSDSSGNEEVCENRDLRTTITPDDKKAPDFRGIKELVSLPATSLEDVSLKASWDLSQDDFDETLEIIRYEVRYTDQVDERGRPVYGQNDPVSSIPGGQETSTLITDLKPRTKYYAKVIAIDESGNESDPGISLEARTRDIFPYVKDLKISQPNIKNPFLFNLNFFVQVPEEGYRSQHRVSSIAFKINGEEISGNSEFAATDLSGDPSAIEIRDEFVQGIRTNPTNLFAANAVGSSEPSILQVNMQPYFTGGETNFTFQVCVEDENQQELVSCQSINQTVNQGVSAKSNMASSSFAEGCRLESKKENRSQGLLLLGLILSAGLLLRRRIRYQ